MKITHFKAENVHGYLPINIIFSSDLTFLTGLNGSGKTSALRLPMALLTPNIEELTLISFTKACVDIEDGDIKISIMAKREIDGLVVEINSLQDVMVLTSAELQMLVDLKRRDELRSPLYEKIISHPVFKEISLISTPMFLGIDRRSFVDSSMGGDHSELRRRLNQLTRDGSALSSVASVTNLVEVNRLVSTKMQEILVEQEQLDEDLRKEFFTRAFEYKPSNLSSIRGPSRKELDK